MEQAAVNMMMQDLIENHNSGTSAQLLHRPSLTVTHVSVRQAEHRGSSSGSIYRHGIPLGRSQSTILTIELCQSTDSNLGIEGQSTGTRERVRVEARARARVRARVKARGRVSWGWCLRGWGGAVQQVHSDDTVIPRQLG